MVSQRLTFCGFPFDVAVKAWGTTRRSSLKPSLKGSGAPATARLHSREEERQSSAQGFSVTDVPACLPVRVQTSARVNERASVHGAIKALSASASECCALLFFSVTFGAARRQRRELNHTFMGLVGGEGGQLCVPPFNSGVGCLGAVEQTKHSYSDKTAKDKHC